MPRIIVCDVNETLLDVAALEPAFKEVFGDARVLQEWFATVLLYSEVATLAALTRISRALPAPRLI
jgi:2-haloacid dehalogenase